MRSGLLSVHSVFLAALLAAMTSVAAPAQQAGSGYWERLRETGRAIVDDLRARAKPRWQPDDERTWGGRTGGDVDRGAPIQYRDEPVARSAAWDPPAADGPTFSRITINRRGALAIEGHGTPGVDVELRTKTRLIGKATTDRYGDWRAELSRPLEPGVYEISSLAKPARSQTVSGADVRISIPDRITDDIVVAFNGEAADATRDPVRQQAERMARDASDRFSQIMPKPEAPAKAPKPTAEGDDEHLAPQPEPSSNPIIRWLERSARAYQSAVIRRLEKKATASAEPPREVVKPNREEPPEVAPRAAQVEPVAPPDDADDKAVAEQRRLADEVAARAAEERRRQQARARAEADAKKRQQDAAAAQARLAEEQRKAEELKKAEEQKKAEAKRLADEAVRKEAEKKRLADEAARAAKQRQAEDDAARRAADAAARQARNTEQDLEADQIAADVKRRKEESKHADAAKVAREAEDASNDAKREGRSTPRVRDARPTEGSAEDAGEASRPEQTANVRPRKCRGPKIRYMDGRRMYLVRPGDTLWTIAERFYGDGVLFPIVYNANRELLSDPDVIIDCKRLFLPKRKNVPAADLVIHEARAPVEPVAQALSEKPQ